MKKPPCLYPRQPTGPSGFGGSGVRDLQRSGPRYQRTRPSTDTLAVQAGDFSRVVVDDEPDYVTSGNDGGLVLRDTRRYQQDFKKPLIKSIRFPISLGGGVYADVWSSILDGEESEFETSYTYNLTPSLTQNATFFNVIYRHEVRFGSYYNRGRLMSEYTGVYSAQPIPGQTFYRKTTDRIANYGKRGAVGNSAVGVATAFFGRTDSAGRQLHDLAVYRMNRRANNDTYLIDPSTFTRANAEFWPIEVVVVLKDYTVVLFAETFFRPGLYDPEEDYRPKFWVARCNNDATFGAFTFIDVTNTAFGGARIPTPTPPPDQYFSALAGRQYNTDLSFTLLTASGAAATGNNTLLIPYTQRTPTGWIQRVVHFVAGPSLVPTVVYESAENPVRNQMPMWQNIAHLGAGRVLAKIIGSGGVGGINRAVTFRMSVDSGLTWGAEFTPVGFDAPLMNQYFGDFTVDRVGEKTVILVNSWRPETQTYHVYASEDMGQNWTRRGKIYKPSEFRRIDTVVVEDGGGSFRRLLPGPSAVRPPDITLPDRYKDRP
jgi:hypothetical protein